MSREITSQTRAGAREDGEGKTTPNGYPDEHEWRVREIILYGRSNWKRGVTGPELAEKWGVSLAKVERAASEANRRQLAQDTSWVHETLCADLEEALREAKTIEDLRDQIRARVEVAKTWAPLVGANAPQRTEITGAGGGPVELTAIPHPLRAAVERFTSGVPDIEGELYVASGKQSRPEQLDYLRRLLARAEAEPVAVAALPEGEVTE